MYKKGLGRGTFSNLSNKRGQITIFMILGLLILVAFIFVYSLTSGIKKGQLQETQEKTLTKAFKKEALRIFVEDCLTDELEKGLVTIGKQGRLWNDQPGGTRQFEEGVTGTALGEERLFYAATNDLFPEYPNAYPCSNESLPPEFCRYAYPNTKTGFGSLELRSSTLENDLRRYMANKTVECVREFTREEISGQVEIERGEVDLELNIFDEGIDIKAAYPLNLKLGGEEFFHLSQFDFFYPTQFKKLLDAAVVFPLRMDWQYVDFYYNKAVLESPFFMYGNELEVRDCYPFKNYFLCKLPLRYDQYSSLGVQLQRQELANGDDAFAFVTGGYTVLNNPEPYVYQFARQNRPPALDYVHRMECPAAGYDYLVVKDDTEGLGVVNISLSAHDPDEEKKEVTYFIGNVQTKESVSKPSQEGLSSLLVAAEDEHGARDWQDVRVLVDRPLDLKVLLKMDYAFWSDEENKLKKYEEIFSLGEAYYVSNEDPVFFNLQFPIKSGIISSSVIEEIKLDYANGGTESFEFAWKPSDSRSELCLSFPWAYFRECDLDSYTKDDFVNWKKLLDQRPDSYFKELSTDGKLNISYQGQYCALFDKTKSAEVAVVVNECVPHKNSEHPWAYPYEKYTYQNFDFNAQVGDYLGQQEINPFEATHSCCIGTAENPAGWRLADENDLPCFIDPEPGCYGRVFREDGTSYTGIESQKGYVLEQQQKFCDGIRGNSCDGEFKNELYNHKLWCGISGQAGCRETIPDLCQDGLAFSIVTGGWCSGTLGCEKLCETEIVYTGREEYTTFSSEQINELATQLKVDDENDPNFDFKCGCSSNREGMPCDGDFDGKFKGACSENSCGGDS